MEDLRYPIGKFSPQETYSADDLKAFIARIESLPSKLEAAVKGMSEQQLDTPYRDGGWTVRQVVHHVPDSHMNAYVRTKWTLSEATPLIKAYDEKGWSETPETKLGPEISLNVLKALHAKWVELLKRIPASDLKKEFIHPDTKKNVPIERLIHTYAWHGDHHLAHITSLKERMGWK
jgi:hypothetical protein